MLLEAPFMPCACACLPHHQLYLISYQTGAFRVKGSYLHWLSLCLLPCALACTAETTPI